jgi:hypothetical protein
MQKGTLAALLAPFFIALSIIITKAAGQCSRYSSNKRDSPTSSATSVSSSSNR